MINLEIDFPLQYNPNICLFSALFCLWAWLRLFFFFLKRVGMITGEDAYIPSQYLSQDLMQAQFVNPAFWLSKYQKLPTNILLDTLFSTS